METPPDNINDGLDMYEAVKEFHLKFGFDAPNQPTKPNPELVEFRLTLMLEELNELAEALAAGDLIEVADGIADLLYVVIGTAISLGIDIRPIFEEVHRTNMLKKGGAIRGDGKLLKPEGWQPPRIAELLRRQWLG